MFQIDKMTFNPAEFGARLGQIMLREGLNQVELARKLGVSHTTISRYLSGKDFPRYTKLAKLIKILNTNAAELTGEIAPDIKKAATTLKKLDIDDLMRIMKEQGFSEAAIKFAKILHDKNLDDWQIEAINAILARGKEPK